MCGRYSTGKVPKKKLEETLAAELEEIPSRYNVCPGQENPTIVKTNEGVISLKMRWGLVPNWSKKPHSQASTINARIETLSEKPFFKDSFRSRRCLVPADGYYEWLTSGKRKTPFFIHLPGEKPLAFAGLWDRWEGKNHEPFSSYTIVTKKAAKSVRFIHHRMPVALPARHWKTWLDPSSPAGSLPNVLADAKENFNYRTISDLVSDTSNDGPELTAFVPRKTQDEFDFF